MKIEDATWTPVGVWGHDGWDLGEWPLVVVSTIEGESATDGYLYGMMVNTEGDRERSFFTTTEARDRAVSKWAQWWTGFQGKPSSMTALSCLSGPYHYGYTSGRSTCPECCKVDAL